MHKHESIDLWLILTLLGAAVVLTIGLSMVMSNTLLWDDVVQPIIVVFGGGLVALLITFPLPQLSHALQVALARGVYGGTAPTDMVRVMLKICDISRREGLLGVADIRSNCPEVEDVCQLIGDAADESSIEHSWQRSKATEVMFNQMAMDVFVFTIIYSLLIGALASIVRIVTAESDAISGANVLPFVSGLTFAVLITILIGRLRSIHLRELVVVEIAYRSAAIILEDNNVHRLRTRLARLVPPSLRY